VEARLPVRPNINTDLSRRVFKQIAVVTAVAAHGHPFIWTSSGQCHLMSRHVTGRVEYEKGTITEEVYSSLKREVGGYAVRSESLILLLLELCEASMFEHGAIKG
jgi:hypothetical protein